MSPKSAIRLNKRRRTLAVALVFGIVTLSLLRIGPAQADIVERVAAVVNEEAIWLSEVRERAEPFLEQVMEAPSQEQRIELARRLRTEVLEQLINEALIEQAARRMRIRVTRTDIERAIANVRRQNNLEEAEFWEAVRGQGFSEAQYRLDLRRQLLRLKVLNQRARGRVNITEDDVRERYDEEVRRSNRTLRFRASHVFFELPAPATASSVAATRERAARIRAQLTVDSFADAVAQNGGGELGWLSQGDLPEDLETTLLAMEEGEISQPILGSAGVHIFLLHERERGAADVPPFEEVRDVIFRRMLDVAMSRQEELFLAELRRNAIIERRLR